MTRANPDNAGVVAPPPLIFGIPLAIALYENQSKPFAILEPRYGRIGGVALVAVAAVLMGAAMLQFIRAHTAIIPNIQRGVIDREERYLEGKFGSDYTDYKMRVRRWL